MEEKPYLNYNLWMEDMWHNTLSLLNVAYDVSDHHVDGEDNSIQLATQQVIEKAMPELLEHRKPIIIIGA